jgi:uncharacterized protein affecting Mg2+/Co2+ transport
MVRLLPALFFVCLLNQGALGSKEGAKTGNPENSGQSEVKTDPNKQLTVLLEPIYPSELPSQLAAENSAKKVNALRITLQNNSSSPIKLLWGDFFVRINNGPWIGSWWEPGKDIPSKMQHILGTDVALLSPQLAPGQSCQFVLTDPWISEQDIMEYKFQLLTINEAGELAQTSSAATLGVPVEVETSGILRAVAGISAAIKGLFPSTPAADIVKPGEFGVSIEHKPIGPVEAGKNVQLQQSLESWQAQNPEQTVTHIYAYQTEVINNTNKPLRLVQLELSVSYEGNWLSGTLRPATFGEQDILQSGYLQTLTPEGEPKLVKMGNTWIPPGGRAVFPANWHPQTSKDAPTTAQWKAVLTPEQGPTVFAAGETNKLSPPLTFSREEKAPTEQ